MRCTPSMNATRSGKGSGCGTMPCDQSAGLDQGVDLEVGRFLGLLFFLEVEGGAVVSRPGVERDGWARRRGGGLEHDF